MDILEQLDYAASEPSAWNGHVFRLAAVEIRKLRHDLEQSDKAYLHDISEQRKAYVSAITECLLAMDMQMKRESGEFHIPQATAKGIWDKAMERAKTTLRRTSLKGWEVNPSTSVDYDNDCAPD